MTDDLETLRPEVREALEVCDRDLPQTWRSQTTQWGVIRAELVRLARENAELRRAWDDALLTGTGILKVERIDPATVMLPVEPRPGNETPVPKSEWEALTERAERAEAELAALKAMIADSAHVEVTLGCAIDGEIPPDLALCKVALVKMENNDV